jgi:LPXTG-motif cell wall-anchored protein
MKQFLRGIGVAMILGVLFSLTVLVAYAGEGGTSNTGSGSPLPFIIGGLAILLIGAGVGLVIARSRK